MPIVTPFYSLVTFIRGDSLAVVCSIRKSWNCKIASLNSSIFEKFVNVIFHWNIFTRRFTKSTYRVPFEVFKVGLKSSKLIIYFETLEVSHCTILFFCSKTCFCSIESKKVIQSPSPIPLLCILFVKIYYCLEIFVAVYIIRLTAAKPDRNERIFLTDS